MVSKITSFKGVFGALCLVLAAGVSADDSEAKHAKLILGWLQSVALVPQESKETAQRLTAKLDSGAKSSAMHALDIEFVGEGDDARVTFSVPVEDERDGKTSTTMLHYDLPLVRESKVKRHDREKLDVRPVVNMKFCMDGKVYAADFSLDNREKFNYPILLGRRFLADVAVVDPAETFVAGWDCPE